MTRKRNQIERKKKATCLILHDAGTADQTACLWNQNSCPDTAIEGFRGPARLSLVVNLLKQHEDWENVKIKVAIYCLPEFSIFFMNYAISSNFVIRCDMRANVRNCTIAWYQRPWVRDNKWRYIIHLTGVQHDMCDRTCQKSIFFKIISVIESFAL